MTLTAAKNSVSHGSSEARINNRNQTAYIVSKKVTPMSSGSILDFPFY